MLLTDGHWFGPVVGESDDELSFGYSHCLEEYCRPGIVNVSGQDCDFQCMMALSRTGVACGACKA